jgi:hypothetical protein
MTSPDLTTIRQWFADALPPGWGTAEILADTDELLIVLDIPGVNGTDAVAEFREATREQRMAIAGRAEAAFGRKVSWAARAGDVTVAFTTATVPVMTRLRLPERRVLDTLIDAGVARSRSEALAWCVRLVGDNEQEWIAQLREAFAGVEAVRNAGPKSRPPSA